MAINPDFHPRASGPANGFLEVSIRPLDVRRVGVVIGPETDGDAESVETGCSEGFDVGFCDKS